MLICRATGGSAGSGLDYVVSGVCHHLSVLVYYFVARLFDPPAPSTPLDRNPMQSIPQNPLHRNPSVFTRHEQRGHVTSHLSVRFSTTEMSLGLHRPVSLGGPLSG